MRVPTSPSLLAGITAASAALAAAWHPWLACLALPALAATIASREPVPKPIPVRARRRP